MRAQTVLADLLLEDLSDPSPCREDSDGISIKGLSHFCGHT